MNEFPAWIVSLAALTSAWAVMSGRAMPLAFRIALASPRLAIFALYGFYAVVDVDIYNRATITRLLLLFLFLTETLSAPMINRVNARWRKQHDRL